MTARFVAGLLGAFMLYFVLGGLLAYPEFTVPDLALGALLVVAALLPGRYAPLALMGASAFALGVYCVAVANQLELGVPVNPPLIVVIAAAALVFAIGAMLSARGSHR